MVWSVAASRDFTLHDNCDMVRAGGSLVSKMKMGRPKLKAEEKRNSRITVVLTKEELQAANDAAGNKSQTSSTWLRNVLRKELGLPEEE
jgi:hypothetical protein